MKLEKGVGKPHIYVIGLVVGFWGANIAPKFLEYGLDRETMVLLSVALSVICLIVLIIKGISLFTE